MSDTHPTQPNDDLSSGIGLLAKEEWFDICAFFDDAMFANPTTEEEMRKQVGMKPKDDPTAQDFPAEFVDAVANFDQLENIAEDFATNVKIQSKELADDLYNYAQLAVSNYEMFFHTIDRFDWVSEDIKPDTDELAAIQSKLDELLKLWKVAETVGYSDKIKDRIGKILERLTAEATVRADKAEKLYHHIDDPKAGLRIRILECKRDFDKNADDIAAKHGSESEKVKDLKRRAKDLAANLETLLKKEKDEVIVMGTSPLYLLIPFIGPLVLAGVNIGVGVDLAFTRAKIKEIKDEAEAVKKEQSISENFVSYYTKGQETVSKISKDIDKVAPQLAKLGSGWRALAADVGHIRNQLTGDANQQFIDEDWMSLAVTIDTAKKMWVGVGERADHFRVVCIPRKVGDPEEFTEDNVVRMTGTG